MKFGFRTPSLKKSLKSRTTGKWNRELKKSFIPGYGKKGIGLIKDPKKAAYNKVYNQTTFGLKDLNKTSDKKEIVDDNNVTEANYEKEHGSSLPIIGWSVWIVCIAGIFISPFILKGTFITKLVIWIIFVIISLFGLRIISQRKRN